MKEEKELHQNFLHQILTSLQIPFACWTIDSEMVYASDSFLQVFHCESAEQYWENYYSFAPEFQPDGRSTRQARQENIRTVLEKGSSSFVWAHILPNGDEILVMYKLHLTQVQDQTYIVAQLSETEMLLDSLEKKYANEKRAKALLDATPMGICYWNKDHTLFDCNDVMIDFLGITSKDEYIHNYKNYRPAEQSAGSSSEEKAKQALDEAFKTGYHQLYWTHLNKDGEEIPVLVTLKKMMLGSETIVVEFAQDLRELRASQQEASAALERAQIMLDTMPLAANFWNKEFKNIASNMAAAKLFGLKDAEEYLEKFYELSPEYQANGELSITYAYDLISKAFNEGYCKFEWLHQNLQGEPIPTEVTLIRRNYQGEDIVLGYTQDLRELKASQEKAREAEARSNVILETMPLSVTFWTKDFMLFGCNAEAVKLFGLSTESEVIANFTKLYPEIQPDGTPSAQGVKDVITKAFDKGYHSFEWMHLDIHGNPLPVEISLVRSKYHGEEITVAYVRDLRELKASQELVEAANERTQVMLDTMPLCANFWSKDMVNIACNAAAPRLFDLKDKQEYLDRFFELSPEYQPCGKSSAEMAGKNIQIAFTEGQCTFEWMHQKLDGTPMPAEISLIRTTLRGEDAVVGYTRDLREIKASQELAQEAEHRSKLMLDSFPMGANFWDASLGLVDCNMEVAKLYGYASKEDYMANFHSILPELQPDGRPSVEVVRAWLKQALESGHERFEFMCIMPSTQEPLPVEVTIERIVHKGAYGAISYVRDLREFKAMLKEIREAEEDLRKAKNVAEQSAKAKSEFLANMSHEIRTPMNGILGLLHLLSATELQADQQNYVHKTLFSANNLLRIINDILDFSKIEAGKLEIEATPFTLDQIFREVYDLYAVPSKEKGLNLHLNTHDLGAEIFLGDPLRLKQILFNLTSNAIKFTQQGEINIDVLAVERTDDSIRCQFSCKDTGIGLSQSQMDRLFSAFSQADTSVTRKYGGTGLGLAISRNLAQMMQGEMWVESVEGEGTTFLFTAVFTLGDEQLTAETLQQEEAANASIEGVGHLLLVEDNEINQLIAEELLRSAGYTVDTAINGQEAIDMLQAKAYDLVLMDIQMPVMDGLTATKKIREMEQFSALPIVAMSAHAMTGDKEISLAHGMNDHITKPIVPETLYSALHYWLGMSRKQKQDS